ncbi:MAG TPA: M23 family metallopeptidase [Sphingomonas sp.]|nr:M23 family metallopeptidase [Sphingomonas sp.]
MQRMTAIAATLMLAACIPSVEMPLADPVTVEAPPPPPPPPDYSPAPPPRNEAPREDIAPPFPAYDRPPPRRVVALPAPRPAWEARPVTADARVVEETTYPVAPGDTLGAIADRTGASADAIARANGLVRPYAVRVGQRLRIPAGRYHFVRAGETGIAIARAYGVEWSRIVAANALSEPYVLRAGQRLAIPGPAPGISRAAERAAAFRLDVEDLLTGAQPAQVARATPPRPSKTARRVLPATTPIVAPVRLAGGFLWPVDGRVVRRFGAGASGERSNGINIAVPLSTPIRAAADGVVAYVGEGVAALGGLIIVKHGDGWSSVYGHAARLLVRRGQSVRRGQTIALSGDTGSAERPQLHFELRKGRVAVDPLDRLPRS